MKSIKIEVHRISDEKTYDSKFALCSSSCGGGSSGSSSNGIVLKKSKNKK